MKIAIVCYPTHGGSGVVASELALGLAERGHEVHIVSYTTPFRLRTFSQNVFIHEVEVASYPLFKYPPYALSLATALADIHEAYDLDLIHAHYAVPHATSAYLAKKISRSEKLKIITTLHGTDITLVGADKSFYRAIKFGIEESDGVTAVSNFLKRRTIEEFDIQRDIRVIFNFVDTRRSDENAKGCARERYAPHGEKILMHASNFRPVKRVSDVVRIFDRVRKVVPSKLVLIGEGPERLFVQQLVKELRLNGDVFFLGQQDYIEHLLSCADLFILPTEQESFGLAALEAHSCGVPVVGAATGGLPEVVADGETGFLLPVGEIARMAECAIRLLTDEKLMATFRKNAKQRAAKCFDKNLILPQYEAFYEEVARR
ncbi:MAG: N-acetyl-alpha-D-glucosaminyl L-malate synthase BshA [Calditrichaeota bacterium]|nr:MAG: N-acetyl-alpha-D-glucosaminyl L-malate synthase BshA [Calditrichota bacterium]